ncbi:MAG: DUF4249 domain-containing protein [Balneolaceae bacterium]
MMNIRFRQLLWLVIPAVLISCELTEQSEYRQMIVIESYLIAGETLPEVRVSRTLRVDDFYTEGSAVIVNAEITISLLRDDGSAENSFFYRMERPGIYRSENRNHRIQSGRTYEIEVTNVPGPDLVRAVTTVPDTFTIIGEIPEALVYQGEQLEVTLSPNENPGRQNYYIFTSIVEDAGESFLTPFYADVFENGDRTLSSLQKNSSGLINEENFEQNIDGSVNIRYPWIGIAFYGMNTIVANSVDRNTYDFIRSQDVQLGGSTLSPGEIPNVIYNVEGGIGIFGSVSTDTIQVFITRPEGF